MDRKNTIGILFLIIASIYLNNGAEGKVSYKGSQVWRVEVLNKCGKELREALSPFMKIVDLYNLDVWTASSSHLEVKVDPVHQLGMREFMKENPKIKWTVIIEDVDVLLKEEERLINMQDSRAFNVSGFNTFEDIETYLSSVASSNPNATLTSIGQTLEGRDLWMLKFSVSAGKPSVWIDCGIHAREWITESTCLWGIDQLNNGIDPDFKMLLDTYDLYILAVVNPDGYSYTWTDDRLWRKNRNPNNGSCFGIDLNRNFDDGVWGGVGSSDFPCQQTYHGASAASELEIQAIQNFMKGLYTSANLQIVYSIHSYSQYWMYPYAYSADPSPDVVELDRIAKKGVDALAAVYGTEFLYGDWYTILYPSTGTTLDFAYALGIKQSYTVELRPSSGTQDGFNIDPEEILPVAIETWTGLIAAILDK